jgi:Zn-dependent protease/CBS domain-containing protein
LLPSSGFKIGRIFGIDIVVHISWLLLLLLFSWSFGALFSQDTPGFPQGIWPWAVGIITGLVLFVCLLLHELSHSYVAMRSGIQMNRITLFVFGGVAEMSEDVRSPREELHMAIAGPLASLIIGGIFGLLYLLLRESVSIVVVAPLGWLSIVNLMLAGFNLLPGFPMDGGRVLRSILWKKTGDLRKATRAASISGQVIGVLVAGAGIYYLLVGAYINGPWLLLIGFFVYQLARSSYQQTLLRIAASDTRVRDIMYTDVPLIDAGTPLTMLRHNYFSAYSLPTFPVVDGGRIIGTVNRNDLYQVSAAEWDVLNAGRLSRPLSESQTVDPDMTLDKVLRRILRGDEFMLVVEGQNVIGLLTREELTRYVQTKMKLLQQK